MLLIFWMAIYIYIHFGMEIHTREETSTTREDLREESALFCPVAQPKEGQGRQCVDRWK
jgi:hypothetical protein